MKKKIKTSIKKLDTFSIFKRIKKLNKNPLFGRLFLLASLLILTLTTILWSSLGALLQQNNADQLVNPYLFQSGATWHGALLPAQHSFLFKWPLFLLVKVFGYTNLSYEILTVITVIVTVGIFAYVLSRIERRPLVLGTLLLALASVLLLIPAQPYSGGILPVNMAMLSTRNLEYVLYILALYFLVKTKKFICKESIFSILVFTLLISSDKLFLTVTLLASICALLVYSIKKKWHYVTISSQWLVISLVSTVLALGVLWLITALHITHISSQSIIGPYGVAHTSKSFALGLIYGFSGVFTNLGANPAFNALTLKAAPGQFIHSIVSLYGFAFIVNILIALTCIGVSIKILLQSIGFLRTPNTRPTTALTLAVLMLWSALAVCILFVASNHYYVVDARYLTLALFSFFTALSVWSSRKRRLNIPILTLTVCILVLAIVSGTIGAVQIHNQQDSALQAIQARNTRIVKTLENHHVKYLVGDYWRVVPIKQQTHGKQNIVPLASCTDVRNVLSSQSWQPNLKSKSFAYLLTRHGSLTDYPNCNINEVIAKYGLPNSSAVISGKLGDPDELLLFYDYGIHIPKHHHITTSQINAAVLPTNLANLMNTICQGPTIMNIVAHQDDDLLFMNPSLIHDIRFGYCIRTIYLTAGDAGNNSPYWLSREKGSEAAYNYMLGGSQIWVQHTIRLPGGQYVSLDQPVKNSKISLIFMHLPDGNLKGQGFPATNFESISQLLYGKLASINTVDRQSTYTSQQLIDGLTAFMTTYLPTQIRTQADYVSTRYPDHSDHITTGKYVTLAHKAFETKQYADQVQIPITFYIGYPIHGFTNNVFGQDLTDKVNTFLAYAKYDGSVCHSLGECMASHEYGSYLSREYQDQSQ